MTSPVKLYRAQCFLNIKRALILPYSLESSFADENIVKPHAGFRLVPVSYWLVNRQL